MTAALGYVRLSLLITPGVIAVGVMALALYATLQIALGIIVITFEIWLLRALGCFFKDGPAYPTSGTSVVMVFASMMRFNSQKYAPAG